MDIEKCNCSWRNYIIELGKAWTKKKKKRVAYKGNKNHGERLVFSGQPVGCQFYLNFITLQIGKVRF
jgi:hypothetical protein